MNKQRLAILIASGLGALATFMPWVKAPIVGTISGTQGDGWITLVLFAVSIVLSLMNDKTKKIEGSKLYGAIIPAVIAALVGIWKIIDFNSKMGDVGDNPFAQALGASVSIEFGLYLVVLAGIATPVLAFLIKDKDQTEE
jgi:hypothetical protein